MTPTEVRDLLIEYEASTWFTVRWAWLPDFVAEWLAVYLHQRAAKRIERFLAGEKTLREGKL